MTPKRPTEIEISAAARKHLARNIPIDFAGYCDTLRPKEAEVIEKVRAAEKRATVTGYAAMFEVCLGANESRDSGQDDYWNELLNIATCYTAINTTIDAIVNVRQVYNSLTRLSGMVTRFIGDLEDEGRDALTLELEGYEELDKIPLNRRTFEDASSLSSKVTIARLVATAFLSQCKLMEEHFDYKQDLIERGRPSTYAFGYAVFALAEHFETWDRLGRKATVNETVTNSDAHWAENYRYTGDFLKYLEAFLYDTDRSALPRRDLNPLARATRKTLAKRRKRPDLHHLLKGRADAQAVLNFMSGLDEL